jgi:predicted amidohydrolase
MAKEDRVFSRGHDRMLVRYRGWNIAMIVCYDIRFPQQFRELARAGAQAVIVPTSWADGEGKLVQWRALAKARALDSTTYVIACDQSPAQDKRSEGAPTGIGHSIIADPQGETLAELGDEVEVAVFDIDIDVTKDRESLPVLEYPENNYEF